MTTAQLNKKFPFYQRKYSKDELFMIRQDIERGNKEFSERKGIISQIYAQSNQA